MQIFISHSSKDKDHDRLLLVEQLLKEADFKPRKLDLDVGDEVTLGVRKAIEECDACVFFLTQESGNTPWCMAELGAFWGTGKPVWILCAADAPAVDAVVPQFGKLISTKTPLRIVEAAKRMRAERPKTPDQARLSEIGVDQLVKLLGERVASEFGPIVQSVSRMARQISVLTPFDKGSVFGVRYDHFFHEKQAIAEAFIQQLAKLLQGGRRVRLLLDAGTTVFPVFQQLADRAPDPLWAKNIRIITNNIPGVLVLLRDAREASGQSHAPLLFDVCVVGGQPSPDYWALLPKAPEKQIDEFIAADDWKDEAVTIGVTTGNYGGSDGRTLFVRGLQHMAFKEAMLRRAGVVYSLMPLGKLLPKTASEVNEKLIAGEISEDPDTKYKDLDLTIGDKRKIVVLTTARRQGDGMYKHFIVVQSEFRRALPKYDSIAMEHAPFDVSMICRGDREAEEMLEMPHDSHRVHLKEWFNWSVDP